MAPTSLRAFMGAAMVSLAIFAVFYGSEMKDLKSNVKIKPKFGVSARGVRNSLVPKRMLERSIMMPSNGCRKASVAVPAFFRNPVVATTTLELTPENVETVLDEVRPYLQADGGSVEFVEIEGPLVKLRLKGACSSCASSSTTMQLGIKRRLQERIPEVGEVVDVGLTEEKLDVSVENVEKILDEIRPYLVGASGGSLEYVGGLETNEIKIRITGPAAKIMTVRVAIQQKIKEKFPPMMRVDLI
eukprot:CAMPEP_0167759934 /NCGR_PEP_ID=MMETSP0110_2-20121227/11301_1 /TAXON_ID=629695 /ORGANISM="Gymnochlora sp., Strain CCMP2014" /LENGTH=243 /DNA_ID=CAMNT_0007646379 /DNA_START=74 /DNA_END=802 /DNA_ORIENTATION=-